MKSPSFSLILTICALIMPVIRSHIIVRRRYTDQLIEEFYDLPALFGGSIPSSGLRVYPLAADPDDACSPQRTPEDRKPTDYKNKKFVLVVARNNCTFEVKVRNAQNAKYDAVIVYNIGSDDLEQMSAKNATGITIPAVFVGETSGQYIKDYYADDSEYVLIINDALPFNINKNLIIPFSVLVGLCFISMIIYMIYKCVREQRRLNQHRLPKRLLKKIPIVKFVEGLPYESCVICLEEYAKGERLRVLPCKHAYHCHCIDVWLTKNRRFCPICKRRVFVVKSRNQNRRRNHPSDSTTDTDDDVQPLINPYEVAVNHGTFHQSEQNENNENQNQEQQGTNNNVITDDEENVLSNNSTENIQSVNSIGSQRENPFNRNRNADEPPVLEPNTSERGGYLGFLKRFFRRHDSLTAPLFNEVENPIVSGTNNNNPNSIAVTVPTTNTSSNNILNANLSGSFQENNSTVTSPIADSASASLPTVQITDSKRNKSSKQKTPKTNANANNLTTATSSSTSGTSTKQPSTSSGSTSTTPVRSKTNTEDDAFVQMPSQGGIGVAALPNTNLNRDQRSSFSKTQRNFII